MKSVTVYKPESFKMASGLIDNVAGGYCINHKEIDGDWYYFYKDGSRPRGIDKIGKYFYYFNGDGKMQTNTLIGDSSKGSLYVGSDGAEEFHELLL